MVQRIKGIVGKSPLITVIVIAVAVIALIWGLRGLLFFLAHETTDDAFITGHITAVSSRVEGHVTKVYVDDNQWVDKDQLLVELDPCDFQTRFDLEHAALAAVQAVLEQTKAQIPASAAEATRAEKDLKRYETLVASSGGITQQQLDNAAAAAQSAAAGLDAANKQVLVAQARVAQAKASARQAELNLSYTKIYAPQSGRLVKKSVEDGEHIRMGQPLMSIVPPDIWVIANFKETQLKNMKPGQHVALRVDAYPQTKFTGHVDSIQAGTGAIFSLLPPENATGNYIKIVQRVPVKIVFDNDPNETKMLSPGMSVEPEVKVK